MADWVEMKCERSHRGRRIRRWAMLMVAIVVIVMALHRAPILDRAGTPPPFAPMAQEAAKHEAVEYGNTFVGFGAANWHYGRYRGAKFAIAFIPRHSGVLDRIWVVWKTAQGYGAGSYGTWTFQLETDNPSGHLPSGIALTRLEHQHPLEGYFAVDLPEVALKAGTVYHLVMWNTDDNPGENWSSPNTIMSLPDTPWHGEGVLNYNGRWSPWGEVDNPCTPGSGGRAAYLLCYTDGTREGQPYYYALRRVMWGNAREGEAFDWRRPDARIGQVGFFVYRVGKPADALYFVLDAEFVGPIATGRVATPQSAPERPSWRRVTLDPPVTLHRGRRYRLYLTAPGCRSADDAYGTCVLFSTAAIPGWKEQRWSGNNAGSVYFDGAWKEYEEPADMSFSLK